MWHLLMAVVLLGIFAAGCGTPEPPRKVNAYLRKDVPILDSQRETYEKADTVAVVVDADSLAVKWADPADASK
jgi:hypothetical protein